MSWERMTAIGPAGENRWSRWRRLLVPSLFFAGVIYYEELFLKLFCFHAVTPVGALFTLLFTLPIAILLGLLCGGVAPRKGRVLLPAMTLLLSVWMGAQSIYYHLFKTFLTAFSLTKMGMVAGAFGDMAVGEILLNWFPIAMMAVPFGLGGGLPPASDPGGGPHVQKDGVRWGPAGGGGPAGCHGHRDVLRRGLHVPALHLSPGRRCRNWRCRTLGC